MPHTQIRYQAQARFCPAPCYGRTPGVSARTLQCLSACQSQTQAPRYGRTPGVSAHDCECLSACQGQAKHDLMCLLKLPGSLHLQPLCSHIGTSGGYGHNNPLSESPGGLSGNPPPPGVACLPSRAARQCRDGRQPHGFAGGSTRKAHHMFSGHATCREES